MIVKKFGGVNKIILDVYRELYSLCGEDFDEIQEKDREHWFLNYYVSEEDFKEILDKHLKNKSKAVADSVRLNVYLGCSPTSIPFQYELTKEGDSSFLKISSRVKWLEYDEYSYFKNWFTLPDVGRTLIMSPFSYFYTWQTTGVLEYSFVDKNTVKFKTKNSNYILKRVNI